MTHQSTHNIYNVNQEVPKKEEKTKSYPLPQIYPIQLMKFTMNINLSPN